MKYLYNLIDIQTGTTEHKKITCTGVSRITGEPMCNIPRMMRNRQPINGFIATGIDTRANVKQTKDNNNWWTDNDKRRWDDRITAAELLRNGGHIVGEGKRKHVVL